MVLFSKTPWIILSEKWNLFLKGRKRLALSERSKSKGFTLIELMVSLAIISMLIAASFGANYMISLRRGRDTKRKGDIKRIQQAFEQYYGANQAYSACDTMVNAGYLAGNALPTDPRNTDYFKNCAANSYCVCANLEVDRTGNSSNSSCGWANASVSNYYCAGSLQ